MPHSSQNWIFCQLGAREHYAIPRALHQAGQLSHLITDAWIPAHSIVRDIPLSSFKALGDRFHPDLTHAAITSFTGSLLQFELLHRFYKTVAWERIIARNHWFQKRAIRTLTAITPKIDRSESRPILFTYSYAALDLLRYAKSKGWFTVLGQIDPGIVEEKIVLAEQARYPHLAAAEQAAPTHYWQNWQAECSLADRIMVNSNWSSQALQQVGIPVEKIQIIPLAYQPPKPAKSFQRVYPAQFSVDRPLRVLFLGQIILRKGIAAVLQAADLLANEPIEFWLVGTPGIHIPKNSRANLRWIGPVPRSAVDQYYQSADVFLFPTLSDGFGLTQLEAQAWKLPLITSGFCGEVVKDQVNGLILPQVTGEQIAETLRKCLNHPEALAAYAHQAIDWDRFSLATLHHHLQTLAYALV